MPPQEIRTPRLVLRRPGRDDAPAIFAYGRDPDVTTFLSWPTHTSVADAEAFVADAARAWEAGTRFQYVLEHEAGVVGSISMEPRAAGVWRVGYALRRESWGQGLATEALGAVVQQVSAQPGAVAVEALVHPDNQASVAVLRKQGLLPTSFGPRCGVLPNLPGGPAASDVWTFVLPLVPKP